MRFQDPELFEQLIQPVRGQVCVRPAKGSRFDADVYLVHLNKTGMFTVRANSIQVDADPSQSFFGVSIPLNSPFTCNDRTGHQIYTPGMVHVLQPTERFRFSAADGCRVLVCNFFQEPLHAYAHSLTQGDKPHKLATEISLDASNPKGAELQRGIARTWTRLLNRNAFLETDLSIKELEDDLIAQFMLLTNIFSNHAERMNSPCPAYLNRAEDYLFTSLESPVTRDSIADIAGVSIRTLSRAFMKRHGVGPITFLRQRRLEAAYRDLLGSKAEDTSVTDVAMRYGFAHLGKFSIVYRKTFGESPSHTLAH